jgi:hypothetical protein
MFFQAFPWFPDVSKKRCHSEPRGLGTPHPTFASARLKKHDETWGW